jgi:hypothetical protein
MKNKSKKVLLVLGLALSTTVNAQWVAKNVDNGLDEPYRICYNKNKYGELLKMENVDGRVVIYLHKETTCPVGEVFAGTLSFLVAGEWHRYSAEFKSDGEILILDNHFLSSETKPQVIEYFKKATTIKFRVECDDEDYEFNMSGSAAALNFIR